MTKPTSVCVVQPNLPFLTASTIVASVAGSFAGHVPNARHSKARAKRKNVFVTNVLIPVPNLAKCSNLMVHLADVIPKSYLLRLPQRRHQPQLPPPNPPNTLPHHKLKWKSQHLNPTLKDLNPPHFVSMPYNPTPLKMLGIFHSNRAIPLWSITAHLMGGGLGPMPLAMKGVFSNPPASPQLAMQNQLTNHLTPPLLLKNNPKMHHLEPPNTSSHINPAILLLSCIN